MQPMKSFYANLREFMMNVSPTKHLVGRESVGNRGWNHELLSQIRKREQLYRSFVQVRSAEVLKTYKAFRNRVNKNIRLAKKEYYTDLFSSSQGSSEQLWKKLRSVIGHVPELLTKLVKDGMEL